MGRITDKLTYANVVATIALFIALGGASYAAVGLPAHSVGSRQLKAGAVTPRALGFPLGASANAFRFEAPIQVLPNPCTDAPSRIESCSATIPGPQAKIGSVQLRSRGELAVSAFVTLENGAAPGTGEEAADVYLYLNGRREEGGEFAAPAGSPSVVPIQAVVPASAGASSIEIGSQLPLGEGPTGAAAIVIRSVSVLATELPAS